MNRRVFLILGVLVLASLLVAFASHEAAGVNPGVRDEEHEGVADEDFGMAIDQRFHIIHANETVQCTQCHVKAAPLEIAQPSSEAAAAAGAVDRRICLGCHMNGPGPQFYEPKE